MAIASSAWETRALVAWAFRSASSRSIRAAAVCIPDDTAILLDIGTDNPDCLADPLYIGWCHKRVRGREYDDFVEAFVAAVAKRWPRVLLQCEDFARNNATLLLERRLCTFNEDVQGTAAVATGTLLAAINFTGVPLIEQRVAALGAGSAAASPT